MSWLRNHALYFAWLISLGAFFGSLFLGEVLQMEPCRLCWYQRIAMYPLTLFLAIATWKEDRKLACYTLPLVLVGGLFALYQSLLQLVPSLHIKALCGERADCTLAGPIPYLSLASFFLIALLIAVAQKKEPFPENSEKS